MTAKSVQSTGDANETNRDDPLWRSSPIVLGATGFISWWLYVALVRLSGQFSYQTAGLDRPLLVALTILAINFGLYLGHATVVLRERRPVDTESPRPRHLLQIIVIYAIAFRVLLLFSDPIQEVDVYRYLWDDKVASAGINPFQFSPHQILAANPQGENADDLERLVAIRDRSPANAEILTRVHFGELTTVYPLVSQFVFAISALLTPEMANMPLHVFAMKSWIVLFDLATLWMLIRLIRLAGRPEEWCLIYAWCPLVLKEFANSGHLDAIAVFLTISALYCAVQSMFPTDCEQVSSTLRSTRSASSRWLWMSAILLSLAIGAKIYPIILVPLLLLSAWRRIGPAEAVGAGGLVIVLTVLLITPMLSREHSEPVRRQGPTDFHQSSVQTLTVDTTSTGAGPSQPGAAAPHVDPNATGLAAFATQWQMNDFLFLVLFEDLKPVAGAKGTDPPSADLHSASNHQLITPERDDAGCGQIVKPEPWFAVIPPEWRKVLVNTTAMTTSLSPQRVPFLMARLLMGLVFAVMALWWASQGMKSASITDWLRCAFLTIAWFWLLLPTQNPWYWIWAMPLVPFAQSRAWLVLSGLTLIYYLRFWFTYHSPTTSVLGTPYQGSDFFDFVVTWIEFGPWFVWLAICAALRRTNVFSATLPRVHQTGIKS